MWSKFLPKFDSLEKAYQIKLSHQPAKLFIVLCVIPMSVLAITTSELDVDRGLICPSPTVGISTLLWAGFYCSAFWSFNLDPVWKLPASYGLWFHHVFLTITIVLIPMRANRIMYGYLFVYGNVLLTGLADNIVTIFRVYHAAIGRHGQAARIMKLEFYTFLFKNLLLICIPMAWATHLHIIGEKKSNIYAVAFLIGGNSLPDLYLSTTAYWPRIRHYEAKGEASTRISSMPEPSNNPSPSSKASTRISSIPEPSNSLSPSSSTRSTHNPSSFLQSQPLTTFIPKIRQISFSFRVLKIFATFLCK